MRRFTSDCEPYEEPSSMKLISRTQSAGRLRDAMSRGFCAPGRGMPLTAYAAPFCTERRMECAEPTKLRRKSGTWDSHRLQELASRLSTAWRLMPMSSDTCSTDRLPPSFSMIRLLCPMPLSFARIRGSPSLDSAAIEAHLLDEGAIARVGMEKVESGVRLSQEQQ